MESYGVLGVLVCVDGMLVGQNSVLVYFFCEDCVVEELCIEFVGGIIVWFKFLIGDYGFIILVKDIEGNMFGLYLLS